MPTNGLVPGGVPDHISVGRSSAGVILSHPDLLPHCVDPGSAIQ